MNSTVMAVLKALTVATSIGLLLSLIPTYYRIYKNKATGDFSIIPAITICFSCSLWMVYGLLVGNYVPVVAVDSYGTTLSLVFMVIYYKYAPDRAYIHKLWLGLGLVEAVIVTYVAIGAAGLTNQSRHQVRLILGFITAGTDVVMYSSPLATLRHVVKIKDASSMPLTMSIVALLNTVLWVIVSTDDLFLAIPNGLGTVFSIIGIIVYFIYRPGKFQPPSEEHRPESEVNLQEIRVEASQKTTYGELQSPVDSNSKQ